MLILRDKVLYGILAVVVVVLGLTLIYPRFLAKKEVKLYFSGPQAQHLIPETRQVRSNNLPQKLIEELIAGPTTEELSVTIPPGTQLRELEVKDRQAVVNFSQALIDNHWGGTTGELLTVFSIVNTLTQLESIERVRIKVAGQAVDTLAGHLDLTQSLKFNTDLVD